MNMLRFRYIVTALLITLFVSCKQQKKQAIQETQLKQNINSFSSLTVFCGSANKPAMEEIAIQFEREKKLKVKMIFGGSGTLLSQIELSKKGEIYLPGSPDYIIIGSRKKLLIKKSDRIVAYLIPGIITPVGNPAKIKSITDLTQKGVRVGIGNPKTVCLGLYAIELLEKNNILKDVMANVVTFGASCSKTASLAAMNQVPPYNGK